MSRALGLVVVMAATACSSSKDGSGDTDVGADTDVAAATFTEIHTALFPQATPAKCDSCHGQPASQVSNGLLHMGNDERGVAYDALVNGMSTSRDCAGWAYVVPGDLDHSLFYQKLLKTPPCGERMPLGGGGLPAAQIAMVKSWIEAGAQDD